mgnify:CR=1 FL=1
MTRINLLPWRDELRKQRQQDFFIGIALVATIAVAILFGIDAYLDSQIEEQQDKKRIVLAKVAEVNLITAKIKDIEAQNGVLQSKRNAIQALQKSRPEIVHFIDTVARVTPEGVFLTKLSQNNARVVLNGKTQSNARVSAFMRNVESSRWLINPELNIIKGRNNDGRLSDFTLHANQWKNKAGDEEF